MATHIVVGWPTEPRRVLVDVSRPESTLELVTALAKYARLPLTEDRIEVVGPALQLVNGLVDQLDALDLRDTPPATAFDARWS